MIIQKIRELKLWRKRPFYVSGGVFLLLIFLCAVRMMLPCKEYDYEGSYNFLGTGEHSSVTVYEGISLPPGVYRVELTYDTEKDLEALCNVADGTVMPGGLRTNGEHLYSALGKTGFCVWLYEKTDGLQVQVDHSGNGALTTGNLKIIETKQLWTMLLTGILFVWLVFGVSYTFYYYDKAYRISYETKNVIFFVGVISLIASVPYLCGYTITGADLTYHLQRIEGVKDGLLGGQFPVRIEPRWLYDHGYADAVFYCNALLYFPALLRMLGFTIMTSYNIYCIALNIATAGIACYCFGRIFRNMQIGIICSALHTLSIFRIYKLLITSAVGEGSAVTFMPLVIYGLYRIFTEDIEKPEYKSAWVPLMAGYAGLVQTHVLTCEITALATILFCILNLRKVFRKSTLLELVKGAAATILVSLWYLVPFLDYYIAQDVHIRHVSARTIQDRGLYLAHLLLHFWKTGSNTPMAGVGMKSSHPVGIGLVLMIVLFLFLILWFSGHFTGKKEVKVSFAKQTAVVGMALLLMSLNIFPWDKIQNTGAVAAALVSSLQFPNRFLGWGTVCLVFVFGFCLWHFERKNNRYYLMLLAVALFGVTTSDMYLLDYVNGSQHYFTLYNEESMGFGYISGAEYLVEGTDGEALTYADAAAGGGVEIQSCEKGALWAEIQCVNHQNEEGYIDVPLLLYKGYQAVHVETGEQMKLVPGENHVIRVRIPADFYGSIRVRFRSPIYWRISEWISAGAAAGMLIIWLKYRRRQYAEKEN